MPGTADDQKLLVESERGILRLTLNRPSTKNAIDWDLRRALAAAMASEAEEDSARVVVIRGAGGNFCSGGDIRQMGNGPEDSRAKLDMASEIVTAMSSLPKPTIAVVEGDAAGAGMSLALACDLVVAKDDARFHPSFVSRGLAPDMGGSYWLTRQLGAHVARRILLEGESIGAEDARALGLVSHVWPAGEFEHNVEQYIDRFACGPTLAFAAVKKLTLHAAGSDLGGQLRAEAEAQVALSATADHIEAIAAFGERRAPDFTGT